MNFHQYITYKTLSQMHLFGESNTDFTIKHAPAELLKQHMRNVCAMVPTPLFDELETICGDLDISKRKFVELALREAIAKAEQIVEEVGMHDYVQDVIDSHQNGQELTVELQPVSEVQK